VSEFILQQDIGSASVEVLPMMHSCECFDCLGIVESGCLEARDCKVFGEKLLYFFYGKPSYPVGEKVKGNRVDTDYCPVGFIVNPNKVNLYRVFPFDTGAFDANLYADYFHHNMKIDSFELNNSLESIQKYISACFTNNYNYIMGNTTIHGTGYGPIIDALIRLLNASGTIPIDERSRTVEVITKDNVSLKDAVECIILPENLLRHPNIKAFLDENHINYLTYIVRKLTAPSRYNEVVFEKAMEYIHGREEEK
jgi:hypothetical protein